MNEYYGTPAASSDFLIHYGIRGMKWGVQKAKNKLQIGSNTNRKLDKHYKKAYKKYALNNLY